MRLERILSILKPLGCDVSVKVHRRSGDIEYIRVVCEREGVLVEIREFWLGDKLVRYAYQLVVNGEVVLRYVNVPHHPEVCTHPHHKHVFGKVMPLENPSLKGFVGEALNLLRRP